MRRAIAFCIFQLTMNYLELRACVHNSLKKSSERVVLRFVVFSKNRLILKPVNLRGMFIPANEASLGFFYRTGENHSYRYLCQILAEGGRACRSISCIRRCVLQYAIFRRMRFYNLLPL